MALVLFQVLKLFIIKNSNIYKSRENKIINPVYQLSTGWAFIFAVSWTCLPSSHPAPMCSSFRVSSNVPFCGGLPFLSYWNCPRLQHRFLSEHLLRSLTYLSTISPLSGAGICGLFTATFPLPLYKRWLSERIIYSDVCLCLGEPLPYHLSLSLAQRNPWALLSCILILK